MELGSRPFMDKEVIKEGVTQVKYVVCGGMCMYVYCPAVTEFRKFEFPTAWQLYL